MSKHNIQYLVGAYRFFPALDAIGLSRYLPLLVYVRGRPDDAVSAAIPWRTASASSAGSG
jgi:hypothetical protein